MRQSTGVNWDAGYRAGKYDFLHRPAERARLEEIARLIGREVAAHGPCEVADIGCGEGLLLEHLKGLKVTRYIGLDISSVALARLPQSPVPVIRICQPLAQWNGMPEAQTPRILVASEVLYYDASGVADLKRVAAQCPATACAIVSCVAGLAGKPNWDEASRRLWRELGETGWPVQSKRTVREAGLTWNIAAYRV